MSHHELAEQSATYALRIMELERKLGECTGALECAGQPIVWQQEIDRLQSINADLLDALQSMLNLEGPARAGVHFIKAFHGIDVDYHCDKARFAISKVPT